MFISDFKPGEMYLNKSPWMTLYRGVVSSVANSKLLYMDPQPFPINQPFMIISCVEASSEVSTKWQVEILIDEKIRLTFFYPASDEFVRLKRE